MRPAQILMAKLENNGIPKDGWPPRRAGINRDASLAWYNGAMHQGRQGRDQVEAAVMPLLRRRRGPASLHALAYNLGNFLRTLAMPETAEPWLLTSLREKLIKIGAKLVSHGRYVVF